VADGEGEHEMATFPVGTTTQKARKLPLQNGMARSVAEGSARGDAR